MDKKERTYTHSKIALSAPERASESAEQYKAKHAHAIVQKARSEALNESSTDKEQGKERRAHQADRHNTTTRRHIISKKDREESFEQTMEHVHKELPRSTRWFSDLIHKPSIEKLSETISATIARPNAILAGGLTAFLSILALYSYAKYAGFQLQGSETIIAFVIGWMIGLIFDGIRALFVRKP